MFNNKLQMTLIALVFFLTFALNYCTKIASCALVFSVLMVVLNIFRQRFGIKAASYLLSSSVVSNMLLFINYDYVIGLKVFPYLVQASLLSVLFSGLALFKVAEHFENRKSVFSTIMIALGAAVMVDATVMSVYFVNYLSFSTIFAVISKELAFKLVYGTVLAAIMYLSTSKASNKVTV